MRSVTMHDSDRGVLDTLFRMPKINWKRPPGTIQGNFCRCIFQTSWFASEGVLTADKLTDKRQQGKQSVEPVMSNLVN